MASIHFQLSLLHHRGPVPRSRARPVHCSIDRQELFSRIAPVYDNLNDLFSLGQHRVWKRMAVSRSGAKEGQYVLDVCCGSGDLSFLLSEKVGPSGKEKDFGNIIQNSGLHIFQDENVLFSYMHCGSSDQNYYSHVVGLDFSAEQLLIAQSQQHLRSNTCFKNNKWIEANALLLPFSDSCFDAITIGYGMRNVVDIPQAMQEMCRVLKPGAKVSVLDFNKSSNQFTTSVQGWVLDNIVVPVARGYGFEDEYRYLKSSINNFLTGNELEKVALEAGFSNAKHFEINGGFMGNLVATR